MFPQAFRNVSLSATCIIVSSLISPRRPYWLVAIAAFATRIVQREFVRDDLSFDKAATWQWHFVVRQTRKARIRSGHSGLAGISRIDRVKRARSVRFLRLHGFALLSCCGSVPHVPHCEGRSVRSRSVKEGGPSHLKPRSTHRRGPRLRRASPGSRGMASAGEVGRAATRPTSVSSGSGEYRRSVLPHWRQDHSLSARSKKASPPQF